ncbi:MAG: MFS transporter [Desulfovibrio sp.]|nr:MFS transporter [Desulfovibrio sp.]
MERDKRHIPLLAAVCAALFFSPLMAAGVNAVLPEIGASLSASAMQLSLVGAAYSLGLAILQLICGSLGDIGGHRRVFLAGAVVFGVCGFLLALTSNIQVFLSLRFVQGLGAAMISAASFSLLASAAAPEKRPAYLAYINSAVYAGIACGPTLAGLIAGAFDWRWIFGLNFAASVCVYLLMKFSVDHEWRPAKDETFDYAGSALYAAAMTSFVVGATIVAREPFAGCFALVLFVCLLIIFILREAKCKFPILNLKLLAGDRVLFLSVLAAFVNYASFFGLVFYFSFYLQTGKGFGVRETGFILSVQPVFQVLCAPLAARLCKVFDNDLVAAAGVLVCAAGLVSAAFLKVSSPLWILLAAQACLGGGISVFSLANTAIILDRAGKKNIGQASSLTGSMRTAGQLSSMVLISFTLSLIIGEAGVSKETLDDFMTCMRVDLVVFGVLNVAAAAIAIRRVKV